jgi:RimJ/RimL family protein N-acetyltransferase
MPSDYSEKFYELRKGKTVLAGIRHLSGSKSHPFVHALLSFVPSASDLLELKEFAATNFQLFSPRDVSFSVRPSAEGQLKSMRNLAFARKYVAGRLSTIKAVPRPLGYERISLVNSGSEADLSWYEAAYQDFHTQHPQLKEWVPMTSLDELRSSTAQGLLYHVLIDGQQAGLIAAKREPLLGLTGAYMMELLLVPPFKGIGLASALQRKFVDELPPDIEVIWGTIDAKNQASMKTALRTGRVAVRSECFMSLGEK